MFLDRAVDIFGLSVRSWLPLWVSRDQEQPGEATGSPSFLVSSRLSWTLSHLSKTLIVRQLRKMESSISVEPFQPDIFSEDVGYLWGSGQGSEVLPPTLITPAFRTGSRASRMNKYLMGNHLLDVCYVLGNLHTAVQGLSCFSFTTTMRQIQWFSPNNQNKQNRRSQRRSAAQVHIVSEKTKTVQALTPRPRLLNILSNLSDKQS